tara:strand:+ start:215 stop:559 length:345 start_codon:yes stop_codon:yes gene_type:complete
LSRFAEGKHAYGFCDMTGFRYKLKDLVPEIVNQRPTGFLVGKDVVDPDQPQLQLGKIKVDDPRSLRDPRPDRGLDESRQFFAFDPVGGGITQLGSRTVGLDITAESGRVKVVTS